MHNLPSSFKSQKGEAKFMAVYDALMQRWPVPYETFAIPGHFGITHVVASGPQDGIAQSRGRTIDDFHGGHGSLCSRFELLESGLRHGLLHGTPFVQDGRNVNTPRRANL